MDCTDLMIGSLVYIHEPECKGHRIDAIDELDGQVGADGELYDECDIRPIPLSEDILMKISIKSSGFTGNVYWFDDFCCVIPKENTFKFMYSKGADYITFHINYLYQLQHLLFVCGIKKELNI